MDAPVQVQERIVEVVNVLPQERVSKRVAEEIVEVPRVVQQERVSERVAVTIPLTFPHLTPRTLQQTKRSQQLIRVVNDRESVPCLPCWHGLHSCRNHRRVRPVSFGEQPRLQQSGYHVGVPWRWAVCV